MNEKHSRAKEIIDEFAKRCADKKSLGAVLYIDPDMFRA
jgi:hypothetical protein